MIPGLGVVCRLAVEEDGVRGAAVLDGAGETIVSAGALSKLELRAIGQSAVARALDGEDAASLRGGGAIALALSDERHGFVGVAGRCLFVVVVDDRDPVASRDVLSAVRADVEELIECARRDLAVAGAPPTSGASGSGSGPEPDELQHVELDVTVKRRLS